MRPWVESQVYSTHVISIEDYTTSFESRASHAYVLARHIMILLVALKSYTLAGEIIPLQQNGYHWRFNLQESYLTVSIMTLYTQTFVKPPWFRYIDVQKISPWQCSALVQFRQGAFLSSSI